jgi:hypothetical protein
MGDLLVRFLLDTNEHSPARFRTRKGIVRVVYGSGVRSFDDVPIENHQFGFDQHLGVLARIFSIPDCGAWCPREGCRR